MPDPASRPESLVPPRRRRAGSPGASRPGPTTPQSAAWPLIAAGRDVLVASPTGTGKTLTGFLVAIDAAYRAARRPAPRAGAAPEVALRLAAAGPGRRRAREPPASRWPASGRRRRGSGYAAPELAVAVRTGDTPPAERAAMQQAAARPARHHARVPLPAAHRAVVAGDAARGAHGHRRRGPHPGPRQARRPPGAQPRAAGPRGGRERGPPAADRAVGHPAAARGGGPAARRAVHDGRPPDGHRRLRAPPRPRRGHRAARRRARGGGQPRPVRRRARPHRRARPPTTARRSSSSTPARWPSGWPTSWPSACDEPGRDVEGADAGFVVAAHHGSLSAARRRLVEARLRAGELRALVATASLELGIDVGPVELVCQIGSPRAIGTFLQRVGRANHQLEGTPAGRLYPLTRDELVECTALLAAVRAGPPRRAGAAGGPARRAGPAAGGRGGGGRGVRTRTTSSPGPRGPPPTPGSTAQTSTRWSTLVSLGHRRPGGAAGGPTCTTTGSTAGCGPAGAPGWPR